MRINAFLSLAGVASRRKADQLIKQGRVSINGEPAQLNSQVQDSDAVKVDGRTVNATKPAYILLNKPAGYLTTLSDPEGRPTVMDLVELDLPLKPVGRLDFNTSGALLLTNDGQLAQQLTHPAHKFEKVYEVKVAGRITDEILNKLSIGIKLDDGMTAPAIAAQTGPNTLQLTIREGRNRQVRRMMEAMGLRVKRLHRSGFGPLKSDNLKAGQWRELSKEEVRHLKDAKIIG
jgi:23S rRNA pseudouridine2605 synthase